MDQLLDHQHFYLLGIKGVAMTSLAQILVDAGKEVTGADVEENFVTDEILKRLGIPIQSLTSAPPKNTDCLIYSSAYQQKLPTLDSKIATFSHAQALAQLFNDKTGVAVCGVGGKSTTSAMLTWILVKYSQNHPGFKSPSFAVGVGNIAGLNKTGAFNPDSNIFVVEADEYADNPKSITAETKLVPRFAYLEPMVTVATNLQFDHPDVYQDFEQTKSVFLDFFQQIKPHGFLIVNADDPNLMNLVAKLTQDQPQVLKFGSTSLADMKLISHVTQNGLNQGKIEFEQQNLQLALKLPGIHNLFNAMAATLAAKCLGIDVAESFKFLAGFASTSRRFEFKGEKNGVNYYDDYAHHPSEISLTMAALKELYPDRRVVAVFQPHTFSRTQALFDDFVTSLGQNKEVILLDIFASARESDQRQISSDNLVQTIKQKYPDCQVQNLHTIENLAQFCRDQLKAGDILITLGAGDIYKVHDLI